MLSQSMQLRNPGLGAMNPAKDKAQAKVSPRLQESGPATQSSVITPLGHSWMAG